VRKSRGPFNGQVWRGGLIRNLSAALMGLVGLMGLMGLVDWWIGGLVDWWVSFC
jgi:hypothetical protein